MELSQALVRHRVVDGVLYNSEGDCVESQTTRCVLDSQRPCHGRKPTLGERYKSGRVLALGAVDETRRDVDYVATGTLGEDLPDDGLGDMEEPGQVHGGDRQVVVERVLGEWFAD